MKNVFRFVVKTTNLFFASVVALLELKVNQAGGPAMTKESDVDIGPYFYLLIYSMAYLNVEIKAICTDASFIRNYLMINGAECKGVDEQTDTYFNVSNGRLKLREGNIENNLIFYERSDQEGPKSSHFQLVKIEDAKGLKEALTKANGIKIVVKKRREIYYIKNVKFHIDEVPELGSFVEIEAGNLLADLSRDELKEQCDYYLAQFGIKEKEMIAISYSDMLLAKISG